MAARHPGDLRAVRRPGDLDARLGGSAGNAVADPAQAGTVGTHNVQGRERPGRSIAIADGEYTIAATATAAARKMWTSFVIVRSGGSWRISAIRNMLPASAP